jgi:hypothetical protein
MRELLKETGFLALRLDYHLGYYAKLVLDRIFGTVNFVGELLVRRMTKNLSDKARHTQNKLIIQNDSIYLYRKSPQAKFCNPISKAKRLKGDEIETECAEDNIWMDIDGYEKKKRTLYPTENSKALLERIITLCSMPGDLIGDLFAGSGTTLYTAALLNRKWIGADIGYYAINEIRKLLLTDTKLQKVSQQNTFKVFNLPSHSEITPDPRPFLHIVLTSSTDKTITLQLQEFICSPMRSNEPHMNKSLSGLDLLDFLAVDWDYHYDLDFFATDLTMRMIYTKGTKAIRSTVQQVLSHQYSKSGQYVIALIIVDIFGRQNLQIQKISI